MNKIPNTFLNSQEDSQDKRLRNTISLKDNASDLFETLKKMVGTNECREKIHSLQQDSKLSAKEADDLAEEYLEDTLEENEEYTEADKTIQAKYNDVIKKQSSLLEEGNEVLSNSVVTEEFIEEYNTQKKVREVLLSDRARLDQEDLQVNVLENKSEGNVKDNESTNKGKQKLDDDIDESPNKGKQKLDDDSESPNKGKQKLDDDSESPNKGKHKIDYLLNKDEAESSNKGKHKIDYLLNEDEAESSNKRSKKDEADKGEDLTKPVAKPSLIDDFADPSLDMPEHTAGDD
jgi:hypothetical protein